MSVKEQIRAEIEKRIAANKTKNGFPAGTICAIRIETYEELLAFLDTLPEQPVSDHHEIEVEFRGEKVTISREFYRNGERNYSTSEQDDNAIWSALRAWCEKKGITPFELYPKQSEQPTEGLEDLHKEVIKFNQDHFDELHSDMDTIDIVHIIARHFAEWQKKRDDLETADLLAVAHLQGMEQQKAKMMEDAVEGVAEELYNDGESQCTVGVGTYFKPGEEVYVIKKED